ncbi:dTMP kinase [Methanobacterium sp. MBAC-LM]|uniref:dTMP kinase n=1 Tax=Methanobacterium sp. MBAC-LM TaxID=3412034 RepID=UPI003C74031F
MYICLEGIDGSGKSTQILLLEEWLNECGFEVMRVFEPTDSDIGRLIRKMLRDPDATGENFQKTLALLFAADRMVLMDEIEAAEKSGKIVISDRCFYSSIVYQNDPSWLYELNKFVKIPEMVILLDLDVETALKRCDGKDSFENKIFLEKIRERYIDLAEKNDFFVINANNGINKVYDEIKRVISPKIGRCV